MTENDPSPRVFGASPSVLCLHRVSREITPTLPVGSIRRLPNRLEAKSGSSMRRNYRCPTLLERRG